MTSIDPTNGVATAIGDVAFFGVGPQRTASTWLYEVLCGHPEIAFPHQVKETMFFDSHYQKGIDWYLWHFRNAQPGQLKGEIGPTYFDDDAARQRIKSHFPMAKIFINVRNPIAKCHSLFRHHLSKGRVPNCFQSAIEKMPRILSSGKYRDYCQNWEGDFQDRVMYLVQEDIHQNPDAVLQSVFECLGIAPIRDPKRAAARVNVATAPRSKLLARALSLTATTLRTWRLHSLVEQGKKLGLKKIYRGQGKVDPVSYEMHQFLADYFESDIQWLEQHLGRDFSAWRTFGSGDQKD